MAALLLIPFLPYLGAAEDVPLQEWERKRIPNTKCAFKEFENEEQRLESFSDPTFDSAKTGSELAANGLFYTGLYHGDEVRGKSYVTDLVQCFWCSGKIVCWHKEDDVTVEHLKTSPYCMFVRRTFPEYKNLDRGESDRLLDRMMKISICAALMNRGMQKEHLRLTVKAIYDEGLPFPESASDLLVLVMAKVDESLVDTKADSPGVKCLTCVNTAMIMSSPCGHVVSCASCSRGKTYCDGCGEVMSARVVARIS